MGLGTQNFSLSEGLNPTLGSPTFKTYTWETSPPKHLTLKTQGLRPNTHTTLAI